MEPATMQSSPTQVVQALFTALQSSDRSQVLDLLTDDVDWWVAGPPEIPFAGAFRGHEEVARFFAIFDAAIDYEAWEAQQFVAEGDTVVVVGEERWRATATGKRAVNPWVLVLTTRDGKIARFRAYEDTAASRDAFEPA
jgi:ketosteroid isomerase-like protein